MKNFIGYCQRHLLCIKAKAVLVIIFLLCQNFNVQAQTINTFNGGGNNNWNTDNLWSLGRIPNENDIVHIPSGKTLNVNINNARCKSLKILGGGTNTTLAFNSGSKLTITDTLLINAPTTNSKNYNVNVNAATLEARVLHFHNTTNSNRVIKLTITTGTANISGNINLGTNSNITMSGAGRLNVGGNISGSGSTTFSNGTVCYKGANTQIITGAITPAFFNLEIDKPTNSAIVECNTSAFDVNSNLTIKKGRLHVNATNSDYNIKGDLIVNTDGTLQHNVNWDTYATKITVNKNISIDGIMTYTVRSHVHMLTSSNNMTIRSGDNPASAFSILTLGSSGSNNINTSGKVIVNDNFWAMFGLLGNFVVKNGHTVTAKSAVIINNGKFRVEGGVVNVTGGMHVGYQNYDGTFEVTGGETNIDYLNLGYSSGGVNKKGTFTFSDGTLNVSGNVNMINTSAITASNNSELNIGGDFNIGTSASYNVSGNTTLRFIGSTNSTLQGKTSQTLVNLEVNKSSNNVVFNNQIGNLTINGNLDITKGTYVNHGTDILIKKNWTNSGVYSGSNTKVTFNNNVNQIIGGSSVTAFNTLVLNNTNHLTLNQSIQITGSGTALTFTNGRIRAQGNEVYLTHPNSTISSYTSAKYVEGKLRWQLGTGNVEKVFPVGNVNGNTTLYTPVTLTFSGISTGGSVMVNSINGDHPQVAQSGVLSNKSVNRQYEILSEDVVCNQYNAYLTYASGDKDAGSNSANYIISILNPSDNWVRPDISERVGNSITGSGITTFGTYIIGEPDPNLPVLNQSPSDLLMCGTNSGSFTAKFKPANINDITWMVSTDGGATYQNVSGINYSVSTSSASGITTSILNIQNIDASMHQWKYKAKVSNNIGVAESNPATLIYAVKPTITFLKDFCTYPGRILVTVQTNINNPQISWNNGEFTTASIIADIAKLYKVTVTNVTGCSTTDSIIIGKELIVNGNFEQGYVGFGSDYTYVNPNTAGGLQPEKTFTVTANPNASHTNFWGRDHTTGSGKMMVINGSGDNTYPKVWYTTVSVVPNTNYYFSAYATSVNNVAPFANLQFNVNGQQVGTTTEPLPSRPTNNNPPYDFIRFYGMWNSGSDTVAFVSIVDLELAAGGNDFAIDDISFGTLEPYIHLTSAGRDSQTVCMNSPLLDIEYEIGGEDQVPVVTGLPSGVTYHFDGEKLTISGSPATAGSFQFTITSTGICSPIVRHGWINVTSEVINLSVGSGSPDPTLCVNANLTPIVWNVTGAATGANATGLPSGVSGSFNGGQFTISGTPTQSGTYNYTVTTSGNCVSTQYTGVITVDTIYSGIIDPISVCDNGPGVITLRDYTGTIVRWEGSTDGDIWNSINNVTNQHSFNFNGSTLYYRAIVSSGVCSNVASTVGTVNLSNYWKGSVDNNWNNPANWADGKVPSDSCPNVVIPAGSTTYPSLTNGSATVHNLYVQPGAYVEIGENAMLQISGEIQANGNIHATEGTIELTGSVMQTIKGSYFYQNTVANLVLSNPADVTIQGADTLKVSKEISFGASDVVLHVNNNLTLLSNENGTARVDDLTGGGELNGNDIVGNVTVERYIPQHSKAWQLLSVPTKGSTFKSAWMENNPAMQNLAPGRGTLITGSGADAVAQGFDLRTPTGATLKRYNSNTNAFEDVPSANAVMDNIKGYMLLVRGDRSVTTSTAPATATTLRTTGQLYTTNDQAPAPITVGAGKFEAIGNPYASAIDFNLVKKSGGVVDMFYVWDPLLTNAGSAYGLGGYQAFTRVGNNYVVTPGGGSYTSGNSVIESGQAFMVYSANTSGTIEFSEECKTKGQAMVFRQENIVPVYFRTQLFADNNGSLVLMDGVMNVFGNDYSNEVDYTDAPKLTNANENLAIEKSSKLLSVEFRSPVVGADTIQYHMSQMRVLSYKFVFVPVNVSFSGVEAFLEDAYTGTSTLISMTDTTVYSFNVINTPAAYAVNRFRLVFKPMSVLPVDFTAISAQANAQQNIDVEWRVDNELNMDHYELERSSDGGSFQTIANYTPVAPNGGAAVYYHTDIKPGNGYWYYRVKGVSLNGTVQYSPIARAHIKETITGVGVYPNPVENKTIALHLNDKDPDTYVVTLVNEIGQTVYQTKYTQINRNEVQNFKVTGVAAGVYTLQLKGKQTYSIRVVIK